MKDKKVIFMGTPDFSVPVLEGLIKETNVVLVVTQPDKKVGRKQILKYSPVKEVALKNNIEVFQPAKIREDYNKLKEVEADIIITCAYGQIIPKEVLNLCSYGAVNVHASILPKLRGGAPIHKAIIYGYKETGVTIMYMDEKMDAGDIIDSKKIEIKNDYDAGILHDKLSIIGRDLLLQVLPSIFDRTNKRIKQDEKEVTYAYNITREEEKINFNTSVVNVYNQIRGLYPFPISYFLLDNNTIKVLKARKSNEKSMTPGIITRIGKDFIAISTEDYDIEITKIKPSGKKEMDVKDYLNGVKKEELIGKKVG